MPRINNLPPLEGYVALNALIVRAAYRSDRRYRGSFATGRLLIGSPENVLYEQNSILQVNLQNRRRDLTQTICMHEVQERYGTCTHVDDPTRLSICESCHQAYDLSHHHERPTGVRGQYCERDDETHPRCWFMYDCGDCDLHVCEDHNCDGAYDSVDDDSHGEPDWQFFTGVSSEKITNLRYTGVELECENGSSTPVFPDSYSVGSDGSLYDGIEVRTPPASGTELVDILHNACAKLKAYGWSADSSRCGTHVHIDMRDKADDQKYLAHLYAMFYAYEDILFGLQGFDRHIDNTYCTPLRSKIRGGFMGARGKKGINGLMYEYHGIPAYRHDKERALNSRARDKYDESRYCGINFHSILYRGTLEVRIHEGTLDPDRLILWIDLLQCIIEAADTKWPGYTRLQRFMDAPLEARVRQMKRLLGLPENVHKYVKANVRQVVL